MLRALGVTTAQRVKAVPEVPPLAEAGMPGYDASSWHTITTTGGVPTEIVDKLYNEIRAIMAEPDVQNLLSQDGTLPQASPSPDAMKKFVSDEIVRWGEGDHQGRDRGQPINKHPLIPAQAESQCPMHRP